MPVDFRIFPSRGLVYVRYFGQTNMAESFAAVGEYMHHPDFRPGQKQLVDMSDVTGFEFDHVELMRLQAEKADLFVHGGLETLIVYIAPTKVARDMAKMAIRSWEPFDMVVARVQETETDALGLLGVPEKNIEELQALAE